MIKTITKALSIILLTIGLSSQGKAQSMPEFGVKGGLNYSTFNDTEDVEYKTGFLVGAYANFKIPLSPVSVQPEILGAQPNVYFGPYMSFNTKAEVANNDGSFNLEDDAKDNEFGVIVGAGIDVSKLRLGLRYTAGLTNVAEDNFNDSAKNGAIALTVGIAF